MFTLRRSADRGRANYGWLDSKHSFSFGTYHDPAHMGFSDLRVINQDIVQPGAGFGTHGHRDMEIITYVLSGTLAHRDSLGNVETIRAGELQRMTAGTGVQHSEYNASDRALVEFLQIWILPEQAGLAPGYEQVALEDIPGWQIVASRAGRSGALTVHQDMRLLRGRFKAGETYDVPLATGRKGWLQVVRGETSLGDQLLGPGDAARIDSADAFSAATVSDSEILLFDLK
jgi:quercetin 2,3-dioxygenase